MPFYKSVSFRLSLIAGLAIIIILGAAGYFLMLKADNSIGRLQDKEIENRVQTVKTTIEIYNAELAHETVKMSAVFGEFFSGDFAIDTGTIIDVNGTKAPALSSGGRSVADDYSQVDAFSEASGGTATIFVRAGDDFVRVVTSVKKADGQRAIGTLLSRTSPAYTSIMNGKAFNGKVVLFGKRFITNYTPIVDARGRIIGIRYVGTAYAKPLAALVEALSSRPVGDTGHIFILESAKETAGNIVYHPTLSGKALVGLEAVTAMLAGDSGDIKTAWPDSPQEPLSGHYVRVPDFNFIVGAVVPEKELNEPIAELRSIFALTAIIVALITGCVLTAVSSRLVRKPLAAGIEELSAIAAGDYTRTIAVTDTGEMGLLQSAMATMQQQVKKVVHEISGSSQELAAASRQLAVLSKGIAEGSREQKDAAASMASTIEELTTNIEQLSQGAGQAQNLSEESQEASEQGATIIRGANEEMQHIANTVRSSSQDITKLYEISEQVSSTIQVIQNIAEQTNLLALNAAIESARAGEAGRGFAVVADEVRGLAGRTTESAKQITDMIGRMREGTKAAVNSMEQNLKGVESAAGMAKAAGDSIGAIQASAARVFDVFSDISGRLQEQSKANEYVARHVSDIGEKAANNDLSVQEVVQSARELESMAVRLQESVAQFRTS